MSSAHCANGTLPSSIFPIANTLTLPVTTCTARSFADNGIPLMLPVSPSRTRPSGSGGSTLNVTWRCRLELSSELVPDIGSKRGIKLHFTPTSKSILDGASVVGLASVYASMRDFVMIMFPGSHASSVNCDVSPGCTGIWARAGPILSRVASSFCVFSISAALTCSGKASCTCTSSLGPSLVVIDSSAPEFEECAALFGFESLPFASIVRLTMRRIFLRFLRSCIT
mmetsp:Transcript_106828/g.300344  ORF Transcript_106828/g.300344 Transcript_106828/m.300344 type:complete len:226 (-) Transcript_106828:1257-1934(-)